MQTYSLTRIEDRFDVSHGDGCYDGRFSREQAANFVTQLLREGHTVIDADSHSYIFSAADLPQ